MLYDVIMIQYDGMNVQCENVDYCLHLYICIMHSNELLSVTCREGTRDTNMHRYAMESE